MLDARSDDGPPHAGTAGSSALRDALRRARAEAAEQTDVVMDLRQAEIARLEILKDALDPVFAEVPGDVDIFDVGLAPGERPRLFVDMVTFVEMGRDRRTYRLMRDGRRGRTCVAESADIPPIVEAVTDYVARRLVERERLLVDDERIAPAKEPQPEPEPEVAPTMAAAAPAETPPAPPQAVPPKSGGRRVLGALAFLVAFGFGAGVGALVVGGLILAAARGLLPL